MKHPTIVTFGGVFETEAGAQAFADTLAEPSVVVALCVSGGIVPVCYHVANRGFAYQILDAIEEQKGKT